jgi:ABC-type uncharacterized transport system substrate-binding protein
LQKFAAASDPVVGWLGSTPAEAQAHFAAAFREGLAEEGYTAGQNVAIEYRWADGDYDRLPALAADLVGRKVSVITTAGGTVTAIAAKKATSAIPIVFVTGADPVENGLVTSLSHPGGNATGVGMFTVILEAKKLELLHEIVPKAGVVAMLVNPNSPFTKTQSHNILAAAGITGQRVHIVSVLTESDFDAAFATIVAQGASALVVGSDPFFDGNRNRLVGLAARYAIPAIYDRRAM